MGKKNKDADGIYYVKDMGAYFKGMRAIIEELKVPPVEGTRSSQNNVFQIQDMGNTIGDKLSWFQTYARRREKAILIADAASVRSCTENGRKSSTLGCLLGHF